MSSANNQQNPATASSSSSSAPKRSNASAGDDDESNVSPAKMIKYTSVKKLAPTQRTPRQQQNEFWSDQMRSIQSMDNAAIRLAHRNSILPLARIKRIMKIDDDVKDMMISAEVPALLAKACEIFIEELTLYAWIHTDDAKRKTLQRNDVAHVVGNYEHMDFLIDILPKEETQPKQSQRGRGGIGTFELPTDAGGACTLDLSALGAGDTHYVLQVGADGITQLVPVAHTQTNFYAPTNRSQHTHHHSPVEERWPYSSEAGGQKPHVSAGDSLLQMTGGGTVASSSASLATGAPMMHMINVPSQTVQHRTGDGTSTSRTAQRR